jgi:hypothetical protein
MVERAEVICDNPSDERECPSKARNMVAAAVQCACKAVGRSVLTFSFSSNDKGILSPKGVLTIVTYDLVIENRHSRSSVKDVILHAGQGIPTFRFLQIE